VPDCVVLLLGRTMNGRFRWKTPDSFRRAESVRLEDRGPMTVRRGWRGVPGFVAIGFCLCGGKRKMGSAAFGAFLARWRIGCIMVRGPWTPPKKQGVARFDTRARKAGLPFGASATHRAVPSWLESCSRYGLARAELRGKVGATGQLDSSWGGGAPPALPMYCGVGAKEREKKKRRKKGEEEKKKTGDFSRTNRRKSIQESNRREIAGC